MISKVFNSVKTSFITGKFVLRLNDISELENIGVLEIQSAKKKLPISWSNFKGNFVSIHLRIIYSIISTLSTFISTYYLHNTYILHIHIYIRIYTLYIHIYIRIYSYLHSYLHALHLYLHTIYIIYIHIYILSTFPTFISTYYLHMYILYNHIYLTWPYVPHDHPILRDFRPYVRLMTSDYHNLHSVQ